MTTPEARDKLAALIEHLTDDNPLPSGTVLGGHSYNVWREWYLRAADRLLAAGVLPPDDRRGGKTIRSFDGRPSEPTPLPDKTPFALEAASGTPEPPGVARVGWEHDRMAAAFGYPPNEVCEYCGGTLQEPGHFDSERHRRATAAAPLPATPELREALRRWADLEAARRVTDYFDDDYDDRARAEGEAATVLIQETRRAGIAEGSPTRAALASEPPTPSLDTAWAEQVIARWAPDDRARAIEERARGLAGSAHVHGAIPALAETPGEPG
jgi:hypothetical protein